MNEKSINELQKYIFELHNIDYIRFYNIVGRLLSRSIALNFREQKIRDPATGEVTGKQSYGRGTWPGLAPSTISYRRYKKKWPGGIGKVTGSLASSIGLSWDVNLKNGIYIGTNKEYARAFHYGMNHSVKVTPKMKRFFWFMFYTTKDPIWRNMAMTKKTEFRIVSPPRPFMLVQKEDIEAIKAELIKMIVIKFRNV